MAGVRFADLQAHPMEFLDFTSLTLDEFQQLVPPFEVAFHTKGVEALRDTVLEIIAGCRFLIYLLGFPVADIGIAVRRCLGKYVAQDGRALVRVLLAHPWWDAAQLEHILVALHVGSRKNRGPANASAAAIGDRAHCASAFATGPTLQ